MGNSILLILIISVSTILAEDKPIKFCPPNFPAGIRDPCHCHEEIQQIECNPSITPWNMEAAFRKIAAAFADKNKILPHLFIQGSASAESGRQAVVENSIPDLKFAFIDIESRNKYTSFHERAFVGTYQATQVLWIQHHSTEFTTSIFPFLRKFVNLINLQLEELTIPTLPNGGFATMKKLDELYLKKNKITKIDASAFNGLTAVRYINLEENLFTAESIHKDAFNGVGPDTYLSLVHNEHLTHLPKDVFQKFLDKPGNIIRVGVTPGNAPNPIFSLACDARVDWICSKIEIYRERLQGYYCKDDVTTSISEYCSNEPDPTVPPPGSTNQPTDDPTEGNEPTGPTEKNSAASLSVSILILLIPTYLF